MKKVPDSDSFGIGTISSILRVFGKLNGALGAF